MLTRPAFTRFKWPWSHRAAACSMPSDVHESFSIGHGFLITGSHSGQWSNKEQGMGQYCQAHAKRQVPTLRIKSTSPWAAWERQSAPGPVSQKCWQCLQNTGHCSLQSTGPQLQDHTLDFQMQVARKILTTEYLLISSTVSRTVAYMPDLAHRCAFFGLNNVGPFFFGTNV